MLPTCFVWTRYGTESGEKIDSILARKELERQGNDGVFLWGIGNSVGPSVRELLRATQHQSVPVLFSPMLSRPKTIDVRPNAVSVWRRAVGLDGQDWEIPEASHVTSRAGVGKTRHYALVCRSDAALDAENDIGRLSNKDLVNFVSGSQVGHSQVTSVVRRHAESGDAEYRVTICASLVFPYVVELYDPEPLGAASRSRIPRGQQLGLAY